MQNEPLTVAQQTLHNLGGAKFLEMTGARHLVQNGNELSMALPAKMTTDRVNYCKVTLNTDDTYTVFVGRVRGTAKGGVAWGCTDERTGVCSAELQETFTRLTGLFTSIR